MSGPLLGTFSIEGLRPLGSPAQRSYELVFATVRGMLDDDHANVFAEPIATRHGNQIDWYANVSGVAVRAEDLPDSDRSALFARLDTHLNAIRGLAEGLARKKSSEEQRLAEALLNACVYPDTASVFAFRGQDGTLKPVITNWAWTRDEQRVVRGVLAGQAVRADATMASPKASAAAAVDLGAAGTAGGVLQAGDRESRTPINPGAFWLIFLGWVLLAAMIVAILWLLLAPCGLRPAAFGDFCPVTAEASPSEALDTVDPDLLAELAVLERQFILEQSRCTSDGEVQRNESFRDATERADRVEADRANLGQGESAEPLTITETADDATAVAPSEAEVAELEDRFVTNAAMAGKLAFSLTWNSKDDLDLAVTCPTGESVSFRTRKRVVCGGKLDIDANTGGNISDRPIENIYFESVQPGRYEVTVRMHHSRSGRPQNFSLRAKPENGEARVVSGSVSVATPTWTWSIVIGE